MVALAMFGCWAPSAHAADRPNVIVIQTDDQNASAVTHRVMPETVDLLRHHGTTFSDYIDSGPLCCPSRAVLLTGQYGHNNGVLWDNPNPYGSLLGKDNTLPVWLQGAGYRTAHIGKYLNLYAKAVGDPNKVPPGWDEWHTVLDSVDYYHYVLRENGRAVEYGGRHRDYLTHVLNEKAVRMIHRYTPRHRPLFMEVDQFAPHESVQVLDKRCRGTAVPAWRDRHLFEHKPLPKPPSFNEADVSDKPSFIRTHRRFQARGLRLLATQYRCRLASLRAVDRGVKDIVSALRSEHELNDTAILFTSDNGWAEGQHRIPGGKVDPYEEILHTPLVMRLPKDMRSRGVPSTLSSTVANIDVAPTILRLAKAKPCPRAGDCRILDGRSLLKAIRSDGRRWPRHRAILLELKVPGRMYAAPYTPCDYQGVRTSHQVYVEHHAATQREKGPCTVREEVEHYDLRSDPFELDNLFPANGGAAAAKQQSLAARIARLSDCAGIEGRDPEPPSGHYCE